MPKQVKENLSQLIRRVISQKKLRLRDIQVKSGHQITESYVSRIMTGSVKNITLDKLIALAKGIGEDEHTLFSAYLGRPAELSSEPLDVFGLDVAEFGSLIQKVSVNPDLIEIMKESADLPPEECQAVRRYVLYLKERIQRAEREKRKPHSKSSS